MKTWWKLNEATRKWITFSEIEFRSNITFVPDYSISIQLFRERLYNWKASKRTRQYRRAWWVVIVHCCIVKFTSFLRDGRRCFEYMFACVKRKKMDSELLKCLFKIYWVFPRLPFGIVAYAFLDNLCRNSCIPHTWIVLHARSYWLVKLGIACAIFTSISVNNGLLAHLI